MVALLNVFSLSGIPFLLHPSGVLIGRVGQVGLVFYVCCVGTGHALSLRMPCPYACPVPTNVRKKRKPSLCS